MDNLEIHNVEQGSEAWHELRCGRFTASRFGDLMAGKGTATYKGLIYSIVGQILSETTEPSYTNDIMQRGIDLEPEAADLYAHVQDVFIKEVGFVTNNDIHPEYVGVSPDRLIKNDGGLLEVKCPIMKTHVGYLLLSRLPTIYKWQVQGQLLITGAEYCDFMSYYPNLKPLIVRVLPDKEMHEQLTERINESVSEVKSIIDTING